MEKIGKPQLSARAKKFKKTIDKYPYLWDNNYSKGEVNKMVWIIIASILVGVIFTALAWSHSPFYPEWGWRFACFYLSSLSTYLILFHIFIK